MSSDAAQVAGSANRGSANNGGASGKAPAWWARPIGGVALGLAFTLALWAYNHLDQALPIQAARTASTGSYWVAVVLLVLYGMALVALVPVAKRSPWFPTVVALLLLYTFAQSLLSPVGRLLPPLTPWQPQVGILMGGTGTAWNRTLAAVTTGVMTFAAVAGWVTTWRKRT